MIKSRYLSFSFFLVIWILLIGCSNQQGNLNPVTPSDQLSEIDFTSINDGEVWLTGTMEIDPESGTGIVSENRINDLNLNITSLLAGGCPGGCFNFFIRGINGTVLTIELEITNPTTIQAYDVRIIYLNTYGKSVMNPDSYTDLFAKNFILPFTAFGKEYANRAFPIGPGGVDTEELLLDFPPGAPAYVDYMIVASIPGNTEDPYEINNLMVNGTLTPSGGNAELSCVVLDHQDDITLVSADTTVFTGGWSDLFENAGVYSIEITNSEGAGVGSYAVLVKAESPNQHDAITYHYFTVLVEESGECGTEAHAFIDEFNVTGVDFPNGPFNGDIVYLEAGPYEGKILYLYQSGKFGLIDPESTDQVMIPFNTSISYNTNFYPVVDSCPMTGRVIAGMQEFLNIFAPDGTDLGTWSEGDDHFIQAAEIDDNGDLWAMIRIGTTQYLKHFEYSATEPYFIEPAAHETNLTADFPPSSYWGCADIAMDFEQDKMFALMARWSSGEYYVVAYDVSSGAAAELTRNNNVFTKNINIMIGGNPYPYYIRRVDIEIEHLTPEYCRIVAGANTDYSGTLHYEIARMDDELNVIDLDDSLQRSTDIYMMPQCLTIANTGNHPMIGIPNVGSTFFYFESTDW